MSVGFDSLPDELVLHLARFLPPIDFVKFSLTSRRIFNLFDNDCVEWRKRLLLDLGDPCPAIQRFADNLLDSGNAITQNRWKLIYLMQTKTLSNWSANRYKRTEPRLVDMGKPAKFANENGTFAYFLDRSVQGFHQIGLYRMDEFSLQWNYSVVPITKDLLPDEEPVKIDDISCQADKVVIKVACPNGFKRIVICFDVRLCQTIWCTVICYSPINRSSDYDSVVLHEKSYTILCHRKISARILVYNMINGTLTTDFELYGIKVGPFFQYCPLQNWLAFTLISSLGNQPQSFTLDLTLKDEIRPLISGKQKSCWSYPLVVLNSSVVMCDVDGLSSWSLKSCKCECVIPLRFSYFIIKTISVLAMDKLDIVAVGRISPVPKQYILHILRIKDNTSSIMFTLNLSVINPFASWISSLGESPILVTSAQGDREAQLMVVACEKNLDTEPCDWKKISDTGIVKFLTPTCFGMEVNGCIEVRDYLQMEYYTMNRK